MIYTWYIHDIYMTYTWHIYDIYSYIIKTYCIYIIWFIYIYIIVFFVSLWFQEKITWSPNWWQTMLLRCWLLWWLWHHPWHHADATSGSFWDKAGMGGWEYGTRLYEKKPFYRARCSGFLKNNISCVFFLCVFLFGESLWSLPCIPFHWDTPTMIWALEKDFFPSTNGIFFGFLYVRFHGGYFIWYLLDTTFGSMTRLWSSQTASLTPPTLGFSRWFMAIPNRNLPLPKESFDASVDIGRHGGVVWVVKVWSIFGINRTYYQFE